MAAGGGAELPNMWANSKTACQDVVDPIVGEADEVFNGTDSATDSGIVDGHAGCDPYPGGCQTYCINDDNERDGFVYKSCGISLFEYLSIYTACSQRACGPICSSTDKRYLMKDAAVFPLAKNLVRIVAITLIEIPYKQIYCRRPQASFSTMDLFAKRMAPNSLKIQELSCIAKQRNILFVMARVALYFVTDHGTLVSSTGKLYLLKDAEVFPLAKNLVPPTFKKSCGMANK